MNHTVYRGFASDNNAGIHPSLLESITMANVGLPGTSGFVGEFLTLVGIFKANTWVAAVATSGVILSAAYALRLYRKVMYGDLTKPELSTIADVDMRELSMLGVLAELSLFLGLYPKPALDVFAPSVQILMTQFDGAISDPIRTAGTTP